MYSKRLTILEGDFTVHMRVGRALIVLVVLGPDPVGTGADTGVLGPSPSAVRAMDYGRLHSYVEALGGASPSVVCRHPIVEEAHDAAFAIGVLTLDTDYLCASRDWNRGRRLKVIGQ